MNKNWFNKLKIDGILNIFAKTKLNINNLWKLNENWGTDDNMGRE
jgi:hypothetical protein